MESGTNDYRNNEFEVNSLMIFFYGLFFVYWFIKMKIKYQRSKNLCGMKDKELFSPEAKRSLGKMSGILNERNSND